MISGLPKTGPGGVTLALGGVGLGTVYLPLWLVLTVVALLAIGTGIVLVRYGWRRSKPVNAR